MPEHATNTSNTTKSVTSLQFLLTENSTGQSSFVVIGLYLEASWLMAMFVFFVRKSIIF